VELLEEPKVVEEEKRLRVIRKKSLITNLSDFLKHIKNEFFCWQLNVGVKIFCRCSRQIFERENERWSPWEFCTVIHTNTNDETEGEWERKKERKKERKRERESDSDRVTEKRKRRERSVVEQIESEKEKCALVSGGG